jgi:hypothetical protein
MSLNERQRAILEFERTWWTMDGEKDLLIRGRFACAPDAYDNELAEVLDDPEAFETDPLLVRRLDRQRDRRRRGRNDATGVSATGGARS